MPHPRQRCTWLHVPKTIWTILAMCLVMRCADLQITAASCFTALMIDVARVLESVQDDNIPAEICKRSGRHDDMLWNTHAKPGGDVLISNEKHVVSIPAGPYKNVCLHNLCLMFAWGKLSKLHQSMSLDWCWAFEYVFMFATLLRRMFWLHFRNCNPLKKSLVDNSMLQYIIRCDAPYHLVLTGVNFVCQTWLTHLNPILEKRIVMKDKKATEHLSLNAVVKFVGEKFAGWVFVYVCVCAYWRVHMWWQMWFNC